MKKYKIEIRSIKSDHLFGTPEFDRYVYVETNDIHKWIVNSKLKDNWGHKFIKNKKQGVGIVEDYDYISKQGGLIIHQYKEPKFNK